MSIKRFAAAGLVASLIVGLVPAAAFAGDDSIVATKAPASSTLMSTVDLRGATARALATTINEQTQIIAPPTEKKSNRRNAASGGASGGGGGGTVMMVVGLVASIGTTYFIYKEMTKETDSITKAAQQPSGFHVR
jgi:hypothetical protein